MGDVKVGDSVIVCSPYWDHGEPGEVVSASPEAITVAVGDGVMSFDSVTLHSSDERWGPSLWIERSLGRTIPIRQ
jgi:hypothetical protein